MGLIETVKITRAAVSFDFLLFKIIELRHDPPPPHSAAIRITTLLMNIVKHLFGSL